MKTSALLGCLLATGLLLGQVAGGAEKFDQATFEKKILELTNAERKKKDLPPLKLNALLTKAARAHSENMAKQGKMEHVLDGKNPIDRIKDSGYQFSRMAENIARYPDIYSPEYVTKAWMDSKIHRDNILNENLTELGVGIVRADNGQVYYTQSFGTPR